MPSPSRRTFLKTSGVLAASSLVEGQEASANDRIRVAIVGCRNRGHEIASAFLATGQFDIATLCDCDTAMFDRALSKIKGDLPNAPAQEQDFRRVLDDPGIDAIVNATPDHWHALMTIMALDAGKHVFLEKPASYDMADGKAMMAAQAKHPRLSVLVGTQQRSGAHFREAREFIQGGGLGKVAFCRAWITSERKFLAAKPDTAPPATLDYDMWLGPAAARPYNETRVHYNWRFFRDYGTGEMGNWGAHWLDIVRWFLDLGYPSSVAGHGGVFVCKDAKEWPDTQTVVYRYLELTVLWEQRIWTRFPLNGEKFGAEFDGEKGALIITRDGWTFYPKEGESQRHPETELDKAHARHFADCVRGDAEPVASMQDGHVSAALCHLGNISVTLNRELRFDAATETFLDDKEANALLTRKYREPWSLPA